jgi:serine/threonine protein kinase
VNKPIPFGKYYLLDRINTGGMAEVFRAKAFGVEGFERLVAVKRILPTIAEDVDFITMFIDEAKIAVQLNHANIAQIFDLGKVGESYFIALEYVHGRDLRALYDLTVKLGEPMPTAMACYVIMKVCEGLDYAHNKRDASGRDLELVHRDVSPQNILISFDGEVKLIDFGIAKAAGKAGVTQAGILKGKFGYLSPEQVEGEEIDRRSDLFGVGIVLYELLTNHRLFAGDSDFSTIEKVRNVEVPRPSIHNKNVSDALEAIVLKALARDRAVRFQTAMELHDELQKFLYSRGEPFGRRDLSAWMKKRFADEASGDHQVAEDERNESTEAERTDVAPILEPPESKAVITETRDAPEEGKAKKSTILGMPAVLPPPDASPAAAKGGRTVPPPPPPRGSAPPPMPGRTVPPPPPRTLPPGVMAAVPSPQASVTPSITAIPSVTPTRMPTMSQPATRTMPPPPPQPAPTSQLPTPVNGASMMAAQSIALEQGNTPQNPVLDMDWDDEELSTQIYDRPEDQAGMDPYESVEAGFEELRSQGSGQAGVPTYVPPSSSYGSPSAGYGTNPGYAGTPQMQVSAAAFSVPLDPPAPTPSLSQPPLGSRAAQVTQPIATHQAGANRSPLYAALAVAAVVLLCFVGYVFLVKTERGVVQLTTHPADATVLFDGKPVGASSPFLVTGVVAGEKHVLEVQKQGYRSWSQEVQVQPGQTLQFPVTLQPDAANSEPAPSSVGATAPTAPAATGGFSLETTPPGARVFLDGNPLDGATPMRVANLVPKKYAVRIELPEFGAQTLDVDVRSGVDQTLPRVTLQPEKVRVRITSEPPSAEAVVVRGDERRTLGKTPLDVTLENNGTPWTLEVARSGFEPFRRELAVENGETTLAVQAVLARTGGAARASSSSPSRSEARAAKEPEAEAPTPEPEPVAAKEVKEVKEPKRPEPVAATGGGNGTLRINSRPWSQVFIDGKLIGNTPQMNVSLPEGSHRVTLVNPEFSLKKSVTITIKAGQTETQIINLQ